MGVFCGGGGCCFGVFLGFGTLPFVKFAQWSYHQYETFCSPFWDPSVSDLGMCTECDLYHAGI